MAEEILKTARQISIPKSETQEDGEVSQDTEEKPAEETGL